MFDQTDLDLRYRAHDERVVQAGVANRSHALTAGRLRSSRHRLALLLLELACRLAPELVTPVAGTVERPAI
jgi:hypothetical protein